MASDLPMNDGEVIQTVTENSSPPNLDRPAYPFGELDAVPP